MVPAFLVLMYREKSSRYTAFTHIPSRLHLSIRSRYSPLVQVFVKLEEAKANRWVDMVVSFLPSNLLWPRTNYLPSCLPFQKKK